MVSVAIHFSEDDREQINQAVQKAESLTSAEIIPVVSASSGRYDRAEDIIGVWLAGIFMVSAWVIFPMPQQVSGDWEATHPVWQLVAILFAGLVGFIVGAIVGSHWFALRRLFTPAKQMSEEVYLKARQVFFDNRVHHTSGATGVLLYVSLYEHRAVVIADQQVLDKIDQAGLDALCAEFTTRLHTEPITAALCETIQHLGERLATELPATDGDKNELPNALVVLE
ncbi:MAG: hypothetical protein KDA65_10260 [Planctomycetaceae bacterium]|nr:hypothetical protein [Planctomycetaceae bacterium]